MIGTAETIRVLHVDEPEATDLTATALEGGNEHITVRSATDAQGALDVLENHDIDCIVSEADLPEMSGVKLCERIREEYDIPFILFTDAGSEAVAGDAVTAGVTDYIRKEATEQYRRLAGRIDTAVEEATGRRKREEILEELHTAAADIQVCETAAAAAERTVEAAETVLEFRLCTVFLHTDGWLEPVAMSSGAPPDGARRMSVDQGLAGKTFQSDESTIVDEIQPDDETDPAKSSFRSGMSIPIGDVGVFQAVSTDVNAFDESDVRFAELLVAHTAHTIDRIAFETELRESRATLQKQNERLERFAGIVSHDLRTPLSVASGHLALAREQGDSEHLDTVAGALDRMEALITDLLTLAREGDTAISIGPVDVAPVVENCWENVRTKDATIGADIDRAIRADEARLRQLFENLFRNAVEHGGADVTVTVGELDDGFYVADDGPGIPPGEHGSVFETDHSTAEQGVGLGLSIVKRVVDAHGGDVSVTESTDGGARFEITGVVVAEV